MKEAVIKLQYAGGLAMQQHTSDDNDQDGLLQVLRLDALRHERPDDLRVQLRAQRLQTHDSNVSECTLEVCCILKTRFIAG